MIFFYLDLSNENNEQKEKVLQKLTDCSLTIEEAVSLCSRLKHFEYTKSTFVKQVGLSWEDATRIISQFTDKNKLGNFKLKPSKQLTPEFKTYCKQTKAAAEIGCNDAAAPNLVPQILVHEGCETSLFTRDIKGLVRVPFKNQSLVLLNVQNVKPEEINPVITVISKKNKTLHGCDSSSLSIEAVKQYCSSQPCEVRTLSVCTLIPGIVDAGAQLATSKPIMVSWWGGKEASKGHLLHRQHEAASAWTVSMMEDTQVMDQLSTTWLNYIIRFSTKTGLLDLYSPNGEPAQIAKDMTLDCITVHSPSKVKDYLKG